MSDSDGDESIPSIHNTSHSSSYRVAPTTADDSHGDVDPARRSSSFPSMGTRDVEMDEDEHPYLLHQSQPSFSALGTDDDGAEHDEDVDEDEQND